VLDDPTGGATHYHAGGRTPQWAVGRQPSAAIGGHRFYNDVE
jgi:spore germination cell wall hydrolase CwlJ-like protein